MTLHNYDQAKEIVQAWLDRASCEELNDFIKEYELI